MCNCNAKYDNKIPCCCEVVVDALPSIICTTTVCPNTQPCNTSVESDCVLYNKDNTTCIEVSKGDSITSVVDIILQELNLIDCTTTVAPTCNCYLLINNSGSSKQYEYDTCGDVNHGVETLLPNQRAYICSSTYPIVDEGIKIGTINDLRCIGLRANCNNPDSYCHQIVVNTGGPLSFQYIDSNGILQNTGSLVTDELYNFCGWQNSFDKLTGVGTFTLTKTDDFCLEGGCFA